MEQLDVCSRRKLLATGADLLTASAGADYVRIGLDTGDVNSRWWNSQYSNSAADVMYSH